MFGKPAVRFGNKMLVKALLTTARLVARNQNDGVPLRIEREGCTPFPVRGREAHFLHVGVFRAFERIDVRATQLRAEFGKQLRDGQKFGLNPALESQKLRLEGIMQSDVPVHIASKLCRVKGESAAISFHLRRRRLGEIGLRRCRCRSGSARSRDRMG